LSQGLRQRPSRGRLLGFTGSAPERLPRASGREHEPSGARWHERRHRTNRGREHGWQRRPRAGRRLQRRYAGRWVQNERHLPPR
jgi:hypothetical protein